MRTVLLTGANRGLGLEFVRQYAADGWKVLACCRKPASADALNKLAAGLEHVSVHALEVTDHAAVEALAAELKGTRLDLVICNAGIFPDRAKTFGQLDYDAFRKAFEVNSLAPLKMAEAFVPVLEQAEQPVFAVITSKMGSIDDNTSGGCYAYRASKAAVNMIGKSLSIDLSGRVTVVVLHPGWVQTDMGGSAAPLGADASIAGMKNVLASIGPDQTGSFFAWNGERVAW